MTKVLIKKSAFLLHMFSLQCFNIPWSSFPENFLKSSKHNADPKIGHTEINSPIPSINSTFHNEYSKRHFWEFVLKSHSTQASLWFTGKWYGSRFMPYWKGLIIIQIIMQNDIERCVMRTINTLIILQINYLDAVLFISRTRFQLYSNFSC